MTRERMKPMSEAPRDGTAVVLWWKIQRLAPNVCYWDAEGGRGWMLDGSEEIDSSETWTDENFVGWTPIVRPLEPEAPEPAEESPLRPIAEAPKAGAGVVCRRGCCARRSAVA